MPREIPPDILGPGRSAEPLASREAADEAASTARDSAANDPIGETAHWESPKSADTGPVEIEPDPTFPVIEGFDLLGRLGRGGMGVVYRAHDRKLRRTVAIKTLRAGLDASDDQLARFEKEARIIAQLRHPHIVQVYEVGESRGQLYLALEFMNGGALSDHLDGTPLPPKSAARIVATLADGASAAHRVGIVHRDLKPGNVLVSIPERLAVSPRLREAIALGDPAVTLKLADFGLAKTMGTDEAQTMSGVVVGTPRYAAPEQVRGDPRAISEATDVYSLGAILYELATGAPVFRIADMIEMLEAIRNREPAAPRLLNPTLDRDLETICLKCLQKAPRDRYATAADLAEELDRWLRGEPLRARPVGALERGTKWVRRHPGAAAFAGVSVLALVAVAAFGVSLIFQSKLARTNMELFEARDELSRKNDLLAQHRYAADMLAAGRAWQEGDVARSSALLLRNTPNRPSAGASAAPQGEQPAPQQPAPPGVRGFEWHYLSSLPSRGQLAELPGVTARYSPDGMLVVLARENEVVMLDVGTLQPVRALEGAETGAAFLAFSGDGKRLLAGCFDSRFRVWEVANGRLVQTFDRHSSLGRTSLSPDGSLALTTGSGGDRTVNLWRVDDGEVLLHWQADNSYAGDVDFSPDGQWFAVGWMLTNSVRIAPTQDPEKFVEVRIKNPPFTAKSVFDWSHRFDPESKHLYLSLGGPVGRIQLEGLSPASSVELTTMNGLILDARSDGAFLATSNGHDHSLNIWQLPSGELLNQRKGHVGGFNSFSFRGTGNDGLSCGPDKTIRFCDSLARQDFTRLPILLPYPKRLVYGPDEKTLAVASDAVYLCDENGFRKLEPAMRGLGDLAVSPDGALVAATSLFERRCLVWRVVDGALVREIRDPDGKMPNGVTFTPDGRQLVIGLDDGNVGQWEISSGQEMSRYATGHDAVYSVGFRPGTEELVAASNTQVHFKGNQMRSWEHVTLSHMVFTHDGRAVFAVDANLKDIHLLDADTRALLQTFSGHQSAIYCHALSPDGSRLATCSYDQTVKLWDMSSGQETLSVPALDPLSVAFSRDGQRLLVGLHNGELRAYDAPHDLPASTPHDGSAGMTR